jgi:TonB family protein
LVLAAPADSASERTSAAPTAAQNVHASGIALPLPDTWHNAGELDVRAEPLTSVHIPYPPDIAGGAAGRVRLRLFIDERGYVVKTEIAASQPRGLFDQIAIHAWQDVRFSPARKDGATVKSQKLLELDFVPF